MKKVLVISYFFPPRPSVASIRLEGMTKYLPQFGWEPIILTAKLPQKPNIPCQVVETYYPGDVLTLIKKRLGINSSKNLAEEIGMTRSLLKLNKPWIIKLLGFFYGILIFPDEQRTWIKYGIKEATEFLKNNKVDCLISSSSPVSSHLIAKALHNKFDIPWVADLRDLWSQNHYYLYGPLFRPIDRFLELKTLSKTQALTTVSEPLVVSLKMLHKKIPVYPILNGFDPKIVNTNPFSSNKEFTIVYTGSISMGGRQDPTLLFKVLRNLIDKKINLKIKVMFYGHHRDWIETEIQKYNLKNIVQQYGEISREQSLFEQRNAQILLFLNWTDPREKGVYTGKVFEYLAAKRPIIALGGPADGVIPQLMETTKAGVHVNDFQTLEKILLDYYREFQETGRVMYHGIDEEINKYSHIEMARKFAKVLNNVVEKKPPS